MSTQRKKTIIILLTIILTNIISINSKKENETIYEILESKGLPMGILPKGVKNYSMDERGRFEVYLEKACNAEFESELHYDVNIRGELSEGHIGNLTGVAAQDLFLWFPVKEIRVDIPSSGVIYFDVGVVFKQFSLSLFESPPDCLSSSPPLDRFSKKLKGILGYLM